MRRTDAIGVTGGNVGLTITAVDVMKATIICIIVGLWSWGHAGAEPLVEGRVRLASREPAVGAQVLLFDLADLRASPKDLGFQIGDKLDERISNPTPYRAIALDEGGFLATSPDVLGLVAEGRSVTEAAEIAQGLVRKIAESCIEHGDNALSGPIPVELGNLTNLVRLELHENASLTGALPQSLTRLTKLSYFFFAGRPGGPPHRGIAGREGTD